MRKYGDGPRCVQGVLRGWVEIVTYTQYRSELQGLLHAPGRGCHFLFSLTRAL